MRRTTLSLSLALGLITSLVVAATAAARPYDYDPPGAGSITVEPAVCPSHSTSVATVPGGVYRAMVDELRGQGYSRARIDAETGRARVVPASGARTSKAQPCTAPSTSDTPVPFQLSFDGALRGFQPVGEVRYEVSSTTSLPARYEGPFTASAPFCASGYAVDLTYEFGLPITTIRRYTCSDGSGDITARVEPSQTEHYRGGSGSWRIVAGTGQYATLRGTGNWSTLSGWGEGNIAMVAFRTSWRGVVAFNDVAPQLSIKAATAESFPSTKHVYRLAIVFAAQDDSDGGLVSYRLTVRGGRHELAYKTGTATSGPVSITLRISAPQQTQRLTVQISASDAIGNQRTIARSLRLPS